jgi:hypothetical protein
MKNIGNAYELVEHDKLPAHWAIKILKGKYKGVVYCYEKVTINEKSDDDVAELDFHFTVLENEKQLDTEPETVVWCKLIGDILIDMLEKEFLMQSTGVV